MADAKEQLFPHVWKTVCQKRPECCQPRDIEMVAWDADDTLWHIKPYGIASSITGPFKLIDEDTLEVHKEPLRELGGKLARWPRPKHEVHRERYWRDWRGLVSETTLDIFDELVSSPPPVEEAPPEKKPPPVEEAPTEKKPPPERGTTITLLPTTRDTLEELKKRGIQQAIISLNSPGSVKRIIEAFGLSDYFVEIHDTWENKGKVFDKLTADHDVCPCNAMFIDDRETHVEDVTKKCGLALQIGQGRDIEKPIEVLKYIRE